MTKSRKTAPDILDVVRAREFQLVDDCGKVRAMLSTSQKDGDPSLILFGARGLSRIVIQNESDGGVIVIHHENGEPAVFIRSFSDGRVTLQLQRPNGVPSFACATDLNDNVRLSLYDQDGREMS